MLTGVTGGILHTYLNIQKNNVFSDICIQNPELASARHVPPTKKFSHPKVVFINRGSNKLKKIILVRYIIAIDDFMIFWYKLRAFFFHYYPFYTCGLFLFISSIVK